MFTRILTNWIFLVGVLIGVWLILYGAGGVLWLAGHITGFVFGSWLLLIVFVALVAYFTRSLKLSLGVTLLLGIFCLGCTLGDSVVLAARATVGWTFMSIPGLLLTGIAAQLVVPALAKREQSAAPPAP